MEISKEEELLILKTRIDEKGLNEYIYKLEERINSLENKFNTCTCNPMYLEGEKPRGCNAFDCVYK